MIVCKVNAAAIVYGNESLEAYIFVAANAVYNVSKRIIVESTEERLTAKVCQCHVIGKSCPTLGIVRNLDTHSRGNTVPRIVLTHYIRYLNCVGESCFAVNAQGVRLARSLFLTTFPS